MQKIAIVLGTRPEAIKLLPLYFELLKREFFEVALISTGQHKEMLNQVLNLYKAQPDVDLDVMRNGQGLEELSGNILLKLGSWVKDNRPNLVIVQGDTTTAMIAALVGFYNKVPVAHIEAGLRTYDKNSPFPEEINRQFIGLIADFHFAPTKKSYDVLIKEGKEKVYLVGNTVIDSLYSCTKLVQEDSTYKERFHSIILPNKRNILITCHRRESFGVGIKNICEGIRMLSKEYSRFNFVLPVHLNPNVSVIIKERLSDIDNIKLLGPLQYDDLVYVMSNSYLVMTDSGGIQEEAPSFGIPVLVLRDTTEREEGIEAGCSKLIGTKTNDIVNEVKALLDNKDEYQRMANVKNPYGDGKASERIVDQLLKAL